MDLIIDAAVDAGMEAGIEAFTAAFRPAARAELERQLAGLRGRVGAAASPTAPTRAGPAAAAPIKQRAPAAPPPAALAPAAGKGARKGAPVPVPAPGGGGAKRTQQQLRETTEAVLAVIKANPGILPEQIAKKLALKSSDITLPLAMLREPEQGKPLVRATGVKRFTKYTAL